MYYEEVSGTNSDFTLIIFIAILSYIISAVFVAKIADKKGYDGGFWFVISLVVSPLLTAIYVSSLTNQHEKSNLIELYYWNNDKLIQKIDELIEVVKIEKDVTNNKNLKDENINKIKVCSACGFENEIDSKFCGDCGNEL